MSDRAEIRQCRGNPLEADQISLVLSNALGIHDSAEMAALDVLARYHFNWYDLKSLVE
ncbi:hypothetical protein FRB90_004930, partial [Tulasnella sp. 427]